MKSLSTALKIEKNKLYTSGPWIILLTITIGSVTYYLCNNNEDVIFGGQAYTAFPFKLEEQQESMDGSIPITKLSLSNVAGGFQELLETENGGLGSSIVIDVVHTDNLTEDYSDLQQTFKILSVQSNRQWITFSLGGSNPYRLRYPKYRYLRSSCNWKFKGAECAYAGAELTCDRTYTRCIALSNTARFGGHRGISRDGYRLVY